MHKFESKACNWYLESGKDHIQCPIEKLCRSNINAEETTMHIY